MKKKKGFQLKENEEIHLTLLYSDEELREIYKNSNLDGINYGELCIQYKQTLRELITHCTVDQVILVHIHADFPQTLADHAIVFNNSDAYNRLIWTDDYNVACNVQKYLEYLNR